MSEAMEVRKEYRLQEWARIVQACQSSGLSNREFCRQNGISEMSPAYIGHIEAPNIQKAMSMDTLFDIAAALDIPAYKFLMFEDDTGF
jgi:transcriptional regulator with XRE-family HTH domain